MGSALFLTEAAAVAPLLVQKEESCPQLDYEGPDLNRALRAVIGVLGPPKLAVPDKFPGSCIRLCMDHTQHQARGSNSW